MAVTNQLFYTQNSQQDVLWLVAYTTGLSIGDGTSVTAYPITDAINLAAISPVLVPAQLQLLSAQTSALQAILKQYSYDAFAVVIKTTTSATFVTPAIGATVSIPLNDTSWCNVPQNILVDTAGYFSIVSISKVAVVATFLGGVAAPGTTIAAGSNVSPATILYEQ